MIEPMKIGFSLIQEITLDSKKDIEQGIDVGWLLLRIFNDFCTFSCQVNIIIEHRAYIHAGV